MAATDDTEDGSRVADRHGEEPQGKPVESVVPPGPAKPPLDGRPPAEPQAATAQQPGDQSSKDKFWKRLGLVVATIGVGTMVNVFIATQNCAKASGNLEARVAALENKVGQVNVVRLELRVDKAVDELDPADIRIIARWLECTVRGRDVGGHQCDSLLPSPLSPPANTSPGPPARR